MLSIRKSPKEVELIVKLEPVLAQIGYGLRDLEVLSGQGGLIRLILDTATQDAPPIGIDDCSKAHQLVSPLFDVWDPLPSAYTLEISSPGECPSLRTLKHFREALGSELKIQTHEAIPMPPPAKPRKHWESKLVAVEESGEIEVEDSMGRHRIKLDQILRASWKRDWSIAPAVKPGKKPERAPKKEKPASAGRKGVQR
jgi:ribosome maturation factor RimP